MCAYVLWKSIVCVYSLGKSTVCVCLCVYVCVLEENTMRSHACTHSGGALGVYILGKSQILFNVTL